MTIDQILAKSADHGIRRTWTAWSELLSCPGASPLVIDLQGASDGLIRIFDSGFPADEMEAWLREWPTLQGWELFYQRRSRAEGLWWARAHPCA